MASANHQFYELQEQVYKRYRKVVPFIVSGMRPNPHKIGEVISWQLQTPASNFDFEEKRAIAFTYEDEVVETYSLQEDKTFYRMNKGLFDSGALAEFDGTVPVFESVNSLSDADVKDFAATKQPLALKKRLESITSSNTLKRILKAAEDLDRPIGIIRVIESRMKEV